MIIRMIRLMRPIIVEMNKNMMSFMIKAVDNLSRMCKTER